TRDKVNGKNEGIMFAEVGEANRAYGSKEVGLATRVTVRINEFDLNRETGEKTAKRTRYDTTVGRALLSQILPPGLPFSFIDRPLKKKEISRLINASVRRCGLRETVIFADKLMQFGFRMATRGGISIAMGDMVVPAQKQVIIAAAEAEV